jgi:hypothetical protein
MSAFMSCLIVKNHISVPERCVVNATCNLHEHQSVSGHRSVCLRVAMSYMFLNIATLIGCGPTWVLRNNHMDGAMIASSGTRAANYQAAVRVLFRHDMGIHNRDENSGTVETD